MPRIDMADVEGAVLQCPDIDAVSMFISQHIHRHGHVSTQLPCWYAPKKDHASPFQLVELNQSPEVTCIKVKIQLHNSARTLPHRPPYP